MGDNLVIFILFLKIGMGIIFLNAFFRSSRKSALLISLGWITSATLPIKRVPFHGIYLDSVIMGVSTALTLVGILLLIEEETGRHSPTAMHLTLPVIPVAYGIFESLMKENCACVYATSGVLLVIGGVVIIEFLSKYYHSQAKLFGVTILLSGVASMAYPSLYFNGMMPEQIEMYGATLLALLTAYAYYQIIYSKRFLEIHKIPTNSSSGPDISPGVYIMSLTEFKEIRQKLRRYPVLAFLRTTPGEEGWITYWIRTIEGPDTIPPTSLYRITQLTSQYLNEMTQAKKNGIVVLEAPEFLKLYNDFRSVLKLLSSLRDISIIFRATLIVVTEKDTWEDKEWPLLVRILH
ncbi:DUF835 domain-containing protein [Thermococcus sp.]|uniref:DUF835 domain-containing protein n=1 Tax=Thermococcus sp. TaxID=35749 RepID=UPI0025E63A90|nr:DUF835 domain-containing protein [Thermococcus sp.]